MKKLIATNLDSLIEAAADGDRSAFSMLYQETSSQAFGIALKILRRRDLAEEAMQDAYLKIWRYAKSYRRGTSTAEAWIATIIRRASFDLIEKDVTEEVSEELPAPEPERVTSALEGIQLGRCLSGLDTRVREAILLSYVYGLSHSEISAQMKAPVGTAKSWVRRGLKQLQECLGAS